MIGYSCADYRGGWNRAYLVIAFFASSITLFSRQSLCSPDNHFLLSETVTLLPTIATMEKIKIDGRTLEGGGQIFRLATCLAALTQHRLHMTDIRGNRSGGGGLKLQHLAGAQWLARAVGAPTRGLHKRCRTLEFYAHEEDAHSLELRGTAWGKLQGSIDVGSPGAVALVLQSILPLLLFSGRVERESGERVIRIRIRGGTNVSNAPSVDYLQQVLCPMLEKIGLPRMEIDVRLRGWSLGKTEMGEIEVVVESLSKGQTLPAFSLIERGEIVKMQVTILAPKSGEQAFRSEVTKAMELAFPKLPFDTAFEPSGHEKRLYMLIVAHASSGARLGRDKLFLQGRTSTALDAAISSVVAQVVGGLKTELEHGACVDEFLRDQLVVFQALAQGRSRVSPGSHEQGGWIEASLHARTACWVAARMLGVEFDREGSCEGVGWRVGVGRGREDVDGLVDTIKGLVLEDG